MKLYPYILFLDFDGVLHRGTTGTFRKMPLLDQLLQRVPDLAIVLSTNWRHNASVEDLRDYFVDPATAARVLDALPLLPPQRGHRQREIEQWLAHHAEVRHYLALDDSRDLFDVAWPALYWVDPREGLSQADIDEIVRLFSA